MFRSLSLVALAAVAFFGCADANVTTYQTRGRVVAVSPETNQVTILHENIEGYMESHEMAFTAKEVASLDGLLEGDLVSFEVEVAEDGSVVIDDLEKLPVDTQLTLVEPMPEPMPVDTTMMLSDSTMVLEDSSATL